MTEITRSEVFFHGADPAHSPWPYAVSAGGRTLVSDADRPVSRQYHEHTLILTLAGQGRIRVAGGTFAAGPGSVSWLDTARPYAHGAAPGREWAYLWFGLSGHGLDALYEQIGLPAHPVTAGMDHLRTCFDAIIDALAAQKHDCDAVMNARIARIATDLFCRRQHVASKPGSDPVSRVMRRLRGDLARKWDIAAMADIAALSPSQFFRRFRAVTGASPGRWLREERMRLARHLLTATEEDVASVARRCGYGDPFHFSRDFRGHHDCPPRRFRERMRQPGGVRPG